MQSQTTLCGDRCHKFSSTVHVMFLLCETNEEARSCNLYECPVQIFNSDFIKYDQILVAGSFSNIEDIPSG